jgi:hypothetical protein
VRTSSHLTDQQIDELFGGKLPFPDLADLARFLASAREKLLERPDEQVEQRHVAAAVRLSKELRAAEPTAAATSWGDTRPPRTPTLLAPVLVRVAATAALAIVVVGALAAGGHLPDSMQSAVARLARNFGISLEDPDADRHRREPGDGTGEEQTDDRSGQQGSGSPAQTAVGSPAGVTKPADDGAFDLISNTGGSGGAPRVGVEPRDDSGPGDDTGRPPEGGPPTDAPLTNNGNGPPEGIGKPANAPSTNNGNAPPEGTGKPADAPSTNNGSGPPQGAGQSGNTPSNGNGPQADQGPPEGAGKPADAPSTPNANANGPPTEAGPSGSAGPPNTSSNGTGPPTDAGPHAVLSSGLASTAQVATPTQRRDVSPAGTVSDYEAEGDHS